MEEKIVKAKSGMAVLIGIIVAYLVSVAALIFGCIYVETVEALGVALIILSLLWLCLGWIFAIGIKVLKPQEALVLTLFGKYIGTLKGEGMFFVNPFVTAVNPAAKTSLRQSGDVDSSGGAGELSLNLNGISVRTGLNNKISLKVMTLNNNKQKINDCLGNPVEIGIAVIWRVQDTAKAVFMMIIIKNFFLFSVMRRCEILCAFIPMMWRKMWTPPETASLTRVRFEAPVRSWRHEFVRRFKTAWKMRACKS